MKFAVKGLAVLLVIVAIAVAFKGFKLFQLRDPAPLSAWNKSNESATATITHVQWQSLLSRYVYRAEDNTTWFNYDNVSRADMSQLAAYLTAMQQIDPRDYPKAEQMAYWINVYNALTISTVLKAWPVNSIKSVGNGLPGFGPWDDEIFTVAGNTLSLNNIEHGILRRIWNDNRIHYAVNCASVGCPNLSPIAFTRSNLAAQLDTGAKHFINHPKGLHFDGNTLVLSSIFNWFVSDFGGNEQALLQVLHKHAEPDLQTQLQAYEGDIRYQYDWELNAH